MLSQLNQFYLEQSEPNRSYFLALRKFINNYDEQISEEWKYKLPFFYYKNKPFCYIWKVQKTGQPYIGIVRANQIKHSLLIKGNRKKMKVLHLDVQKDVPIQTLKEIFSMLIKLY